MVILDLSTIVFIQLSTIPADTRAFIILKFQYLNKTGWKTGGGGVAFYFGVHDVADCAGFLILGFNILE